MILGLVGLMGRGVPLGMLFQNLLPAEQFSPQSLRAHHAGNTVPKTGAEKIQKTEEIRPQR